MNRKTPEPVQHRKFIPTALDASAVESVIKFISGNDEVPCCEAADAAYHVGGFVLHQFVPNDHPTPTPPTVASKAGVKCGPYDNNDKEECVKALTSLKEKCCGKSPTEVKEMKDPSIPWYMLWTILRDVLDRYLRDKLTPA